MLEASHKETENVTWILEHSWFDDMQKVYHRRYVSEDGCYGKDVISNGDDEDYEEIWRY